MALTRRSWRAPRLLWLWIASARVFPCSEPRTGPWAPDASYSGRLLMAPSTGSPCGRRTAENVIALVRDAQPERVLPVARASANVSQLDSAWPTCTLKEARRGLSLREPRAASSTDRLRHRSTLSDAPCPTLDADDGRRVSSPCEDDLLSLEASSLRVRVTSNSGFAGCAVMPVADALWGL